MDTETQAGRTPCKDGGRDGTMLYKPRNIKDCQQISRTGTEPGQIILSANSAHTLVSDFWPPGLWEDKCLLFKLPSVGDFVTAAMTN